MKTLQQFVEMSRQELPRESLARWGSIFFSLSVLTVLFSLAAAQAFLALAGLAWALDWTRRHGSIAFPHIAWPLLLFCLLTLLSVLAATNQAVGWFAVRKLVLFLIILLSLNLVSSLKHLEWLYRALFLGSAAAGAAAAAQFVIEYRAVRAVHPGRVYFYMANSRITGFQGHWMNFGGQQMLVWIMLAAFLLRRRQASRVWWAVAAIITTSIVLNFTRGVWLGCFVAGVYLVARWKPRLLWAVPALVLVAFLASPRLVRERLDSVLHPSEDSSIAMRFEMWGAGWRMIQKHPWLGVGPNNINEVYDLYLPPGKSPAPGYHGHLHSDYVQFAAERGLPCLAVWLWLMGALGWQALKVRRSSSQGRWLADGAFAGWLALMVEGSFEFNFGTSPVLMVYLFVASAPFMVERLERSSGAGPPPAKDRLSSRG